MTLDIHRASSNVGRVSTINMPPVKGSSSSSSGRMPLQSRNLNAMSSSGNNKYSSTTENDYSNGKGLSTLESSNNEMNNRLTSSASYANSAHLRRHSSTDVRDTTDPPESTSSSSKPAIYSRSNSAPTKIDDNSVIIEEKRKKANGDGYTIHRYIRGRLLGKGGFAKVYLCTAMDTNKTYAIKIVPKANLVKARARQKVSSPVL